MHKTAGTNEWSPRSLNCYYGCSNNCNYCYAKRMALRFKRIEDESEWEEMKPNWSQIRKGYREVEHISTYDYMFPTSHDITPESLKNCLIVLKKILKANNTVLITTKPNLDCIETLCNHLHKWKDQILFRFTITSWNDNILKKYEPNAPRYQERYEAVFWANHECGYNTSLSLEPFLDKDPIYLITRFFEDSDGGFDIITDTIWLGIMSGKVPEELKPNYTKKNLIQIYEKCEKLPKKIKEKIRFKDSIVNYLSPLVQDSKIR